ncbi:MAG: xanthine dehydrogenase family protein molybdopterin-binding subunit [Chloroflexota bacterium]|nr:MAG: xanthine dehydrogenase family protein molybdopterin-binding subunit [Chloroflexota bacterium]
MKTADRLNRSNIVLSSTNYKVVGTRPIRHDGADKVTGRAIYGADFKITGLLHGKVLRSPHAHARIRSIDVSKALAYPGVRAAIVGSDFPEAEDKWQDLGEGNVNLKHLSDNVMATDIVLYRGHAVAAVAAISPHIADEALKLIEVDYEVLPAVLDVREAMKDGAPLLHASLTTQEFGKDTGKHSNIAQHFRHELGDVAKGFQEADVIVEREVRTATVHQGYIEPHNATALWNADGNLTVWGSTQGAFPVRDQLVQVLKHPVSKIKVVPTEIGGGFGGKIPLYLQPIAAILSKKTGRPVKVLMSRSDEFQGTGPSPASWITCRIGAKKDGRITAVESMLAMEAGAYPGSAVGAASMCIWGPYDIPNGRIDGYDVVCNKPRSFAYRAPGSTQAAFASEVLMDALAEKLGMDPIELRLKNSAKEGTRRIDGPVYNRIGGVECLEAARNHDHWKTPLEPAKDGQKRGRGIAHGFWFNVGLASSCSISVNPDGTVTLIEGSTDIGGTRTSVAMQAAEVLGIAAEDVRPSVVDTDSIGFTHVTGGSRTTFATGLAACEAAQDIVRQMKERAAKLWEIDASAVDFKDGAFSSGSNRATFQEIAGKLGHTGGPITGRGNVDPGGHGGAFATMICDVEVDPETGKVRILRWTTVQDAGKAVHPSYVEGQLQGGTVQGIGWALNEEYQFNSSGAMTNPSFLDYRMPLTYDLPMIDTVIVEVPNPGHPFGVRGVGEVPIIPPPAALANAINDAIGLRMSRLPMSPRNILEDMGVIARE